MASRISNYATNLLLLLAGIAMCSTRRVAALSPDGHALLDLKETLTITGPSWTNSWNASDESPCSWDGVLCDASGHHVVVLNLTSQVSSGTISPSLGRLRALQILDLSSNNLLGPIPPEIGNCTALVELHLQQNMLNGTIPANLAFQLQSLKKLDLSFNGLSGSFPPEFNPQNLTYLHVEMNQLTGGIPQGFGNLVNLEELVMYDNLFAGRIPAQIGALPKLQALDLGYNLLTGGIPPTLFNNSNLVYLKLTYNTLAGDITAGFEALSRNPAMILIDLSFNDLTGTIPPSIGNMTSLETLILGNNSLTGNIPKEVGNLKELTGIGLYANKLNGIIPVELEGCSKLQYIALNDNPFDRGFMFPTIFQNMGELVWLDLSRCSLGGQIPSNVSSLSSLSVLMLASNYLEGIIPSSLFNLTTLSVLDLGGNGLLGDIHPNIGNLKNLDSLVLTGNFISGALPIELAKCRSMTAFSAGLNNLTGTIPKEFGNLKSLEFLNLANNKLVGEFPSEFSQLVNLTTIYFGYNNLSGQLHPELGKFSQLQHLEVHHNSFDGVLPLGLCEGHSLTTLKIKYNLFEGAIPTSLGECNTLVQFFANNNHFTDLPSSGFQNTSSLLDLDISSNIFKGPLYFTFGPNCNVQRLRLSHNNFSGPIPTSLANCKNLTTIDFSFNNLNGSLQPLENLTAIQELQLQANNFTNMDVATVLPRLIKLFYLDLASNEWGQGFMLNAMGSLTTLSTLNISYGNIVAELPTDWEKLQMLEILDVSHNALVGTIPPQFGNMISLSYVDLSFNNLTGVLPPTWVKFLTVSPNAFIGNPGLCLLYTSDNLCVNTTKPKMISSSHLNPKQITTVVVFTTLISFCVMAALIAWCQLRQRKLSQLKQLQLDIDNVDFVTRATGSTITFREVMEATEYMSEACVLKKGAFGTTYKGTLKCGKTIVLKKIEAVDGEPQIYQSFLTEIKILQGVKHRNIVKLLGFCKWARVGYIISEYMPNGDLHDMLHGRNATRPSRTLNWPQRLHIAKGIASGLAYLHHYYSPQIVHRDVKASNVLLDENLEAHLTDFGIAKVLAMKPADTNKDSTTLVVGSYGYIAPEHAFGIKVTPKVDIYSYGVLLLELLTGRPPIVESDPHVSMHIVDHIQERLQDKNRLQNDILDPALCHPTMEEETQMESMLRIALLCTQKNPHDRPTSKEVIALLHQLTCIDQDDENVQSMLNDERLIVSHLVSCSSPSVSFENPSTISSSF